MYFLFVFEDNHIFILYSLLVSSEYSMTSKICNWVLLGMLNTTSVGYKWTSIAPAQVVFCWIVCLNYCFSSFDSKHWLLCFQGNTICSCWWIGLSQLCGQSFEVFQWRSQFLVSCINIFFFRIWFSTSLSRHWMLNLLKVICGGTIMFVWRNQWNHIEWSV